MSAKVGDILVSGRHVADMSPTLYNQAPAIHNKIKLQIKIGSLTMPNKLAMMKNALSRRKPLHGDASDERGGTSSCSVSSGGNDGVTASVDLSKMSLTGDGVKINGNHFGGEAAPLSSSTLSQPAAPDQGLSPHITQKILTSPPISPLTPPRGSTTTTNEQGAPVLPQPQQLQQPKMIDGVKDKVIVVVNDTSSLDAAYERIPLLETIELPRGGVSIETQAVGYVQYGIPPETIKDSMRLGIPVPSVYIVPVDRFCREMGPALGVNLAEFEFPAYFNFFVQGKRCTLVVDSVDAERNIQRVFSETLLGPLPFRRKGNPLTHAEEGKREREREIVSIRWHVFSWPLSLPIFLF